LGQRLNEGYELVAAHRGRVRQVELLACGAAVSGHIVGVSPGQTHTGASNRPSDHRRLVHVFVSFTAVSGKSELIELSTGSAAGIGGVRRHLLEQMILF
jgi:hypothetical protein